MLARIVALVGILVALGIYAEVLAHAPATGQDLRLFYAAATVLRHGGNPYEQRQLYQQEQRLYRPTTAAQRASLLGNPLPEGPPLVIALMPAVGLPAAAVYKAYAGVLAVAAAAGLALLCLLWPVRRPVRRIVLGLASPVTFLGLMLGQPDALFLLALVLGLWLLYRGRAPAAGFVLLVALIKPQIIAGPIVLLAVMAWRRGQLGRYVAGLLAGVVAFAGISLLLAGPTAMKGWVDVLAGFGRSTVYTQVDISSLTTLYLSWAPHPLAVALSALTLLAWAGVSLALWRGAGAGRGERWWLAMALSLWLLATPYAHPHDDVLLLPAVWYLLDDAPYQGSSRLLVVLLCAAWWLLPMTSVLGLRPPVLRGLGIVPVALVAALLAFRKPPALDSRTALTPASTSEASAKPAVLSVPARRVG